MSLKTFRHEHFGSQAATTLEKISSSESRPDKWWAEFAEKIDRNKTERLQELQELKENLEGSTKNFEAQVVKLLTIALAPRHSGGEEDLPDLDGKYSISHMSLESQPLFHKTTLLLNESQSLLEEYTRFKANRAKKPRIQERIGDLVRNGTETERIVEAGKRVTASEIEALLAGKHNQIQGRHGLAKVDESLGKELLSQAEDEAGSVKDVQGWGILADRIKKVAAKMYESCS